MQYLIAKFLLILFVVHSPMIYSKSQEKFVIGPWHGGFFSAFAAVINNIIYAEKHDMIPVVYWDQESKYYQNEGYNGSYNAWEYYFEPISNLKFEIGDAIYRNFPAPDNYELPWYKTLYYNLSERLFIYDYIKKYVKLKPSISKKIDSFYHEHIDPSKKLIGIHFRGTDKWIESKPVNPLTMINKANEIAKAYGDNYQFLVASDEERLIDLARQYLLKPPLVYHAQRSQIGNPNPLHLSTIGKKAILGEEVLIEAYLLSKSDFFIHTFSNVASAVCWFNPYIKNIYFDSDNQVYSQIPWELNQVEKNAIDYVTIAILAKDKEHTLPLYLACIEKQTWPKEKIYLYIRTNNNNDATVEILKNWIKKIKNKYADIFFDDTDVIEAVEKYGQHEWNCERFKVLGRIRQESVKWAHNHNSHYFVADCDNFIKSNTIESLIKTNLPVVAPLLRTGNSLYSNFHAAIDANGYFADSPLYCMLLNQEIKGLIEVPVVHCTYFIRNDVLQKVSYDDESYRYTYVIFSDSARKNNIRQYLDTRDSYGYISFAENVMQVYREPWLGEFR